MAKRRRKSKRMKKIEPAVLQLQYEFPAGVNDPVGGTQTLTRFIDIASDLSRVNRRLYKQNRNYAIGSIQIFHDLATVNSGSEITVSAAGNTWITQNAHVKGEALWNQMNDLVLDDMPSIEGKWADFKIYLTEDMDSSNILKCTDGAGGAWPTTDLEWQYSKFVIPQHATAADGSVIPAQEAVVALCGEDDVGGATWRMSLINAYERSRATVQDPMPNAPAGAAASFYSLLTDYGGQETELGDVIEDANDVPPYSNTEGNYPGGSVFTTHNALTVVGKQITSQFQPTATIGSFIAPCGLIRVASTVVSNEGVQGDNFKLFVNLVPGSYRGVMSEVMGQ
jgi:hypothetical protein